MATTTSNVKPTSRQLAYLKALANRTGQTFTYPQTAAQASAEITRLKQATPSTGTERYVERKLIADQIAAGPIDSARVREDEIAGRGSSATWVHNREQDPPRRRIRAPPRRASAGHRWWAGAPSWRATPCLTGPSGCSTAKRVDGSVA